MAAPKQYYENASYVADEVDNNKLPTVKSDQIQISLPIPLKQDGAGSLNSVESDHSSSSQNDKSSRENILNDFVQKSKLQIHKCRPWIKYVLFVLYNVYFVFAIVKSYDEKCSWCDGVKLLIILTAIVYFVMLYYIVLKKYVVKPLYRRCIKPIADLIEEIPMPTKYKSAVFWAAIMIAATAFVLYDTLAVNKEPNRLASGAGLIGFLLIGYIFSAHRSAIKWRQVLWGITMQFVMGLIVLRWSVGRDIFDCLGQKVTTFLGFTTSGSGFVFGYLANDTARQVWAFFVLPVIVFFSFFVAILYYWGIMQVMVAKVGWFLQVTIGTTACESMNAAGNIFLGMTEAPLMIAPFLPKLTKSELHAVMTGGFATIAGSVLAGYISFGISASHLLSASIMAAPGALAVSKLFYPETEESQTTSENIVIEKGKEQNALEAAGNGASQAIKLVANIVANLIAFLAFIAFINALLGYFGSLVGWNELSFEYLAGKILIPLALMMGTPWEESQLVASLIGTKTIINEFIAYQRLSDMIKAGTISKRAETIATFALCGFSNLSSIGIQMGGLGALAPSRKSDLAALAFRAMIAGCFTTFISACIAGLFVVPEPQSAISVTTPFTDLLNVTTALINNATSSTQS